VEGSPINQWLPIPSLSTTRIRIPDQAETALPGFATIEIDPNASVVSAILRNPAGEEVVIPPTTASRAAAVFVEYSGDVTTQIVALRFTESPIQLSLYDTTGNLLAERTWTGPGRQLVSSLADLFDLQSDFVGTLHLRSVGNIATIGIRLKSESWDVVPSVPIDATGVQNRLLMPHFADGWGWSTTFTTLNSGEKLAATSGRFNDEVGNELPVKVDGVLKSTFTIVTPARGVSRVSTSGDSDPLKSGFVNLDFDTPGGVLPMFRNGAALEVISALPLKARAFALGAERSEKIDTAIAIVSPSSSVVRFRLLDSSGSEVASGIIQGNPIKTATVISQLTSLPPAFQGILLLDSDDEFVPLSLRLGGASLAANPVFKQ
jgi:hypothetical protein